MSRIRSIHPGLWTDEAFVSLSPFARLLAMGIWNECDDKGTFAWSPIQMKMRILPADNVDAPALMAEIEGQNLIRRYEVDGKSYGAVRNFCKYQRPKKPNDIFPITAEISQFVGMSTEAAEDKPAAVPNHSPTSGEKPSQMEDGGGRGEEKEKEPSGSSSLSRKREKPQKRKSRIPENWKPAPFGEQTKSRKIIDNWPPGELDRQVEKFEAHHTARGSLFDDWQAAWRTWVLNSEEFGGNRRDRPGNASHAQRDGRDGQTRAIDERLGLGGSSQSPGPAGRRADGDGGRDRELQPARIAANR